MTTATLVRLDNPSPARRRPPVGGPLRARRSKLVAASLVALVGVAVTCGLCYKVREKPGVYWADVKVLFLAPTSALLPNALVATSGSLVSVAGIVGKMVDPNLPSYHVVSPDVSLVNQGIRNGYAVSLPNEGGQWQDKFDQAVLDVQAVRPSAQEATQMVESLIDRINVRIAALQDAAHVPPVDRIHTSLSPNQIQTRYAAGRPMRAMLATALLGGTVTCIAAIAVCRRRTEIKNMDRSDEA
jgi:hypothetical protein